MKNVYLLPILLCCWMLCMSSSCKKNKVDPNVDQLSLLPSATQTGANTFGCIVNGKAFLPNAKGLYSDMQCNYIYTNGGYYLNVSASNGEWDGYGASIGLTTTLLSVQEGQVLKLEDYNIAGKACGQYAYLVGSVLYYQTTSIVNGQMHITKFDQNKQIISGTFSFNAVNSTKSDTIHVTDGRFDMKYTQ